MRVLRAQCSMDAVPPPELELLVDILSLFRSRGCTRMRKLVSRYFRMPRHSCRLLWLPSGGQQRRRCPPRTRRRTRLPRDALVQFVLEKHREKAHGLSCCGVSGCWHTTIYSACPALRSPRAVGRTRGGGQQSGPPGGISAPKYIIPRGVDVDESRDRGNPSSSDQLPGVARLPASRRLGPE